MLVSWVLLCCEHVRMRAGDGWGGASWHVKVSRVEGATIIKCCPVFHDIP